MIHVAHGLERATRATSVFFALFEPSLEDQLARRGQLTSARVIALYPRLPDPRSQHAATLEGMAVLLEWAEAFTAIVVVPSVAGGHTDGPMYRELTHILSPGHVGGATALLLEYGNSLRRGDWINEHLVFVETTYGEDHGSLKKLQLALVNTLLRFDRPEDPVFTTIKSDIIKRYEHSFDI